METKPLTCTLCPFATHSQQELDQHQLTHSFYQGKSTQLPLPLSVKQETPLPSWWPSEEPPTLPPEPADYGWETSPSPNPPRPPPAEPTNKLGLQLVVVGGAEGKADQNGGGGSPSGSRAALPPPIIPLLSSSSSSSSPSSSTASCPQTRQHWQTKQFRCDLCPFVARGKQELRVHEREEHLREGSDIIQCARCSYSTNKISSWRQHKLVHPGALGSTGSRIYMCKTCGWKTKYRHSLVKHIALHTGNKSFQCDQCGFACARKENLKRHKLTHLKKGVDGKGLLLKCGWCEYATAYSNALRRHAVTLHNADENYIPEYQCDICDFRTTKLSNFSNHKITHLYGHMMVQVNQTGPLKCSLCPFVSEHWDCLQEHQRTHKELRCVQELLGSSSGDGENAPRSQPQPIEAEDQQNGAGESRRPNRMVALRNIIGTIGEHVNGEGSLAPEVQVEAPGTPGPACRARGGRRRRWRSLSGAPPFGWEGGSRLSPSRRFRCPHCRFSCPRREGLRRHLSGHTALRTPAGEGQEAGLGSEVPGQNPQLDSSPVPQQASSSPVLEPRQVISQEPQQTCPMPGSWLERERLALEKERLALKRKKWEVQRGVLALQEHKLRLQVELLQQQLRLTKN
ncbi:zinc finger protein 513-like [Hypanus sabinus]|uniref:zinc finger protein 513-like n=1 Tax=Hypanus sabinus TaxID=79690 RepID=UPI0028C4E577|nr:zinc finger protein 513-like [Hypanus sabinus]